MIACLGPRAVKSATHPPREPHLGRQQHHLPAVAGSCAVLTKKAGPDDFEHRRTASSSRPTREMPQHGSHCVVDTTPAAVDQQNDVRGCAPVHAHDEVPKLNETVRWSQWHSRLLATLKRAPGLLPRGSRVLVAVSGGQDSMALLRLLIDLQRLSSKQKTAPWPLQLVVGHCDHNIRADSAENEKFVRDQADRMDFWLRKWRAAFDVVSDSSDYGLREENSAAGSIPHWVQGLPLSTPGEPAVIRIEDSSSPQQQGQASQQSSPDSYMELGKWLLQETTLQPLQQAGVQAATAGSHNSQAHVAVAAAAADNAQQRRRSSRHKGQRKTRLQQNQDSDKAEDFVCQRADQLGLLYLSRTAEQQLKSEAAARSWRHKMLAEMTVESGCSHVLLGHTATDRAETLMLNLVRGAGPSGLCSMGWRRRMTDDSRLQLVRPLLDFTREETAEVCRVTGTKVYEDSTNSDDQYSRNRYG